MREEAVNEGVINDIVINDYMLLIDAIKQWISVAESQMCALDVVSHQLPDMRVLLEDNVEAISTHFSSFASEINSQKGKIEEIKSFIADDAGNSVMSDGVSLRLDDLEKSVQTLNSELMECIVRMQFQDRISQNLVIAANVIAEIQDYLEDSVKDTTHAFEDVTRSKNLTLDKEFAKKMLKHLTLGELQHKFVSDLIQHGYIQNETELDVADIGASEEGDVELF